MARKLQAAAAADNAATPPADDGAGDLAIMLPDIPLTLAGRTVTVREPRFVQSMRIRARAHALMQDLTASIKGGEGLTDDVLDVLAKHDVLVRELIVEVTEGADVGWIEGLSEPDGETLLLAWWTCCGPFFVRQIARRLGDGIRVQALMDQAFAGSMSSPPSPPSSTATSTGSSNTAPSVN